MHAVRVETCAIYEETTMSVSTRRAFLGFAKNAVAAAAVGAIGVELIATVEATPLASGAAQTAKPPSPVTTAQWWGGPPPRPGWGPGWGPPPRRRRRWVCWWHRGRRRCGWRW